MLEELKELNELSEGQYHALQMDSYSTIKDFIKGFRRYYKKYITKEGIQEKNSQYSEDYRFGSLVDCCKFTPETFTDVYFVSTAKMPTGQMLDFTNTLHSLVVNNTNEYGVLCADLAHLMEEAYSIVGIKRDKLETIKERFVKEGKDYFLELKDKGNRTVISPEEIDWAKGLADWMSMHPHTRDIFNKSNSETFEVLPQYKIKGEIAGLLVKGMVDLMHIDHDKKIIDLYDLKVMSNSSLFTYNYLQLMYYIQNAVYTTLVRQLYPDYSVLPIKFIIIDKYRNFAPLVVETTEEQYNDAMNGFISAFGRPYPGLLPTIEEMLWHKDTNIWDCSKKDYENNGRVILEINNFIENDD